MIQSNDWYVECSTGILVEFFVIRATAFVLVIDELMCEAGVGDKEARNHNEEHLAKLSQLASQGIRNNIFLVVGAQNPKFGNSSRLLMRNLEL